MSRIPDPVRSLALSVLLLGTTGGSLLLLLDRTRAPASNRVDLRGAPDFAPAVPAGLGTGAEPLARIAFVGDIMHHREQDGDDFALTYRAMEPVLRPYDLVVGSLEFPVDPHRPVPPDPLGMRFNGSEPHLRALGEAGVDLVSTATNHAFDMGHRGVLSTLEALRAAGIGSFGTGARWDDLGPRTVDVGPLRIAFVGYTFPPNAYVGESGELEPWPREWPIHELYFPDWRGPYRREGTDLFLRHVTAARADSADLVVAFVHWGEEWRLAPNRHQRLAARDMAAAGFDLVVGSHSHVLNPAEWVDGTLTAYSLGNFVSAFRELELRTSAVFEVSLVEGADGRIAVGDFAYRPIVTTGLDHQVRPVHEEARGELARALRVARSIVGEAAVRPFELSGGEGR